MRQLMFVEAGRVEWQDAPDPDGPAPDGAVVRPLAVARCDLDAPMAAFGLFPGPYPVGHEAVAEIVALGDDVTGHRVGDRVLVSFQVSCGSCTPCRGHRFAACSTHHASAGAAFGFGPAGGGHGGAVADVLVVPHADHLLVAAPPGLDDALLCTVPDNVIDGYRTVAGPLAREPGADVLVVAGAGSSIGLYAVACALGLGSSRVRYVDPDADRCAAAEAMGAEAEHLTGAWPRRFERARITVAYSLDVEALTATVRSTDEYGWCTSAAIHFEPDTPLPLLSMYTRGITLHTSRADSRRYLPEVLDLLTTGRLDLGGVPTTLAPFDAAADVWLDAPHKLVLTRTP